MTAAAPELAYTVGRNSSLTLAAQLGIKLLSFGFSVLVVRNLGAEAFGQYAAVLAFGAMFVFLADLGLSPYTVREVARLRDQPAGAGQVGALFGQVLWLRFLLSLLAGSLVVLVALLTDRPPVMVGAIALGSLGLVLHSLHGVSDSVLAGFERLDLSAAAKVLNQVVFVAVGAAALWVGAGYYGLMVANLLGAALMALVCWRALRRLGIRPGPAGLAGWPVLVRASLPFGVIGFTLGLSYRFDSVLLNLFRGDAETGFYSAAYNLVFSAAVLSNALNTALYPSLSRQLARDRQLGSEVVQRTLKYLLILSLPIAVGGSLLSADLVRLLFTDSFLASAPALQILIWAVPLMFVSEFLGYLALVTGDERRVARALLASTAFGVALTLVLVPRLGFMAAAATTVATEVVLVGQYVWSMRPLMRSLAWQPTLGRPLLATALMGAVLIWIPALPVLVSVPIGALVYGCALLATGAIDRTELHFIRRLAAPRSSSPAQA